MNVMRVKSFGDVMKVGVMGVQSMLGIVLATTRYAVRKTTMWLSVEREEAVSSRQQAKRGHGKTVRLQVPRTKVTGRK